MASRKPHSPQPYNQHTTAVVAEVEANQEMAVEALGQVEAREVAGLGAVVVEGAEARVAQEVVAHLGNQSLPQAVRGHQSGPTTHHHTLPILIPIDLIFS